MNKILSNGEIALITGTSATDAQMSYWQKIALDILSKELEIKEFDVHSVDLELYNFANALYLRVKDFPVDTSTIKLYNYIDSETEITSYTFRADDRDEKKAWILDEDGNQTTMKYDKVFISYSAGYLLQGTIEVLDNDIEGKTLTIDKEGVETVYTFIAAGGEPTDSQIELGATAALTAANIATKLSGTADGAVVTLPLGSEATTNAGALEIEIENANIPYDLKAAVAYIVAGGAGDTAESDAISSYKIGTKTVSFRNDIERNFVKSTIGKYAAKYKETLILS